jgi:hypothetical protein
VLKLIEIWQISLHSGDNNKMKNKRHGHTHVCVFFGGEGCEWHEPPPPVLQNPRAHIMGGETHIIKKNKIFSAVSEF